MLRKALTLGAVLLVSTVTMTPAHAEGGWGHGGHHGGGHWGGGHWGGHNDVHLGFSFGNPLFWGARPYYQDYAPVYYAPRTVIIEREPPVYMQRPVVAPAPPAQVAQLWYYCPSPAGYYPHIANCSQAWVPVDPSSLPPSR